jgi:hypothetical protein
MNGIDFRGLGGGWSSMRNADPNSDAQASELSLSGGAAEPLWTNLRCYSRFLPVFGRPLCSEVIDFSGSEDETEAL